MRQQGKTFDWKEEGDKRWRAKQEKIMHEVCISFWFESDDDDDNASFFATSNYLQYTTVRFLIIWINAEVQTSSLPENNIYYGNTPASVIKIEAWRV